MRRVWCTVLLSLLLMGAAFAAPPQMDARPALGDALVEGRWQPLLITLQNPDTGDALQGEVQVVVEDLKGGNVYGTYVRPVTLPRGAGIAQTSVLISLPEGQQPDITVYLVNGRDGNGSIVTRKRFEKIPVRMDPLTFLAVSLRQDTLSYLQSEGAGVFQELGVLRKAQTARQRGSARSYRNNFEEEPVRVQQINDPALLPDRPLGYDVAGLVYLAADIPPAAFSDSQVEALRLWVAGGGALIVSGDKLRSDERFRSWFPAPQAVDDRNPYSIKSYGRGRVGLLAFDPTAPGFAESPGALERWRNIVQECVATPSVGRSSVDEGIRYYGNSSFINSVMHAPGMRAPGIGYIGLFLVGYLVLLVPINYLILRRLDRREWAWITVPVLVIIFSTGAYWFGLSTKGTQIIRNAAAIIEMDAGSGEAITNGVIGVFSPSRSRYRVSVDSPDAQIWEPTGRRYGSSEYGPLVVSQKDGKGSETRDAEISMWAMRSFVTRTSSVKLGEGVRVSLRREKNVVTGTIENRTGRKLSDISVYYEFGVARIKTLAPGEKQTLRIATSSGTRASFDLLSGGSAINTVGPENATPTTEATRIAIAQEVAESLSGQRVGNGDETLSQQIDQDHALVVGWNYDSFLPVTINGQTTAEGVNVNLLLVRAPVQRAGAEE